MIVRIAGEGQHRVPDNESARLNELDSEAVAAVEARDEARFHKALGRMIDLVRQRGELLPGDELTPSDVILPPPDTSLDEAAADFTGEGLIPDT